VGREHSLDPGGGSFLPSYVFASIRSVLFFGQMIERIVSDEKIPQNAEIESIGSR
jgi:hypothetical protein